MRGQVYGATPKHLSLYEDEILTKRHEKEKKK